MSSLIASALERRFPPSQGYGTLFPERKSGGSDASLIKIYAQNYVDTVLFPLGPVFMPWDKFPDAFLKDRAAVRALVVMRVVYNSHLCTDSIAMFRKSLRRR